MPSTFDITKTRAAALLAVCALGAGGGLLAGCGGDSENTSDDTVPAEVTTAADGSAVTVPSTTDSQTVTAGDVQTLPAPTTTGSGSGSGSTTSPTVTGTSTSSATVPGGSPSTAPENPGGASAPDDNGRTTTSGSGSGSDSSGGSNADQDPDCKPGTGPGQPLPQCEPVSGEDAQENEG
jgi:hypothetical protein